MTYLSDLSPRRTCQRCAVEFTGSPALDLCEDCESYDPATSSPAEDDDNAPAWEDDEYRLCGQFWTWLYAERKARGGREPSDEEKSAHPALEALRDLRARRAIRDMHQLAVDSHAAAVREHFEGSA